MDRAQRRDHLLAILAGHELHWRPDQVHGAGLQSGGVDGLTEPGQSVAADDDSAQNFAGATDVSVGKFHDHKFLSSGCFDLRIQPGCDHLPRSAGYSTTGRGLWPTVCTLSRSTASLRYRSRSAARIARVRPVRMSRALVPVFMM